jgi:hypothetical protein
MHAVHINCLLFVKYVFDYLYVVRKIIICLKVEKWTGFEYQPCDWLSAKIKITA